MIAPNELLAIKQRMLVAAEAAYKIASSNDQFVMHDPEQFELVITALLALKTDASRLLAEHDILRGMFAEKLSSFFMEAIDGSTGSAEAVSRMPRDEGGDRGEAKRDEPPDATGTVLRASPARKRAGRSNSRRNSRSNAKPAVELERGNGEVAVGGEQG